MMPPLQRLRDDYGRAVSRARALVARHRERVLVGLGAGLALGLAVILAMPDFPGEAILVIGRPSPGDIIAPRAITYPSQVRTEEARVAAEVEVSPVYGPRDRAVAEAQRQRADDVLTHVGWILANPLTTPTARRADILDLPELSDLPARQVDAIQAASGETWERVRRETVRVVALILRNTVTPDDVPVPTGRLMEIIDPSMDAAQAELVAHLARSFIVANSRLDPELTEAARDAARDRVEPQMTTYSAGQIIARAGDPLNAAQLEAMAQLGLLRRGLDWAYLAGLVALMIAVVSTCAGLLWRLAPQHRRRLRVLALAALLILGVALGARFILPGHVLLGYAYPAAAVAATITIVLGLEAGTMVAVILAVAVGIIAGPDLEMAVYVLLGSLAGSVVLGRMERLTAFLAAGLAIALVDLAVMLGFRLGQAPLDLRAVGELAGVALVHGGLSTSLAALGALAAGPLFGVTTSLQLMELGRPDHPLLRELRLRAPGTYQHSILLGNLAEAAAAAIGADVLLVRVVAYYHDVGKLIHPHYFIENQGVGENPHDKLDPDVSASIIVAHVTEGVELAQRYRLPAPVIDAILQHHGTLRAEYFYQQAVARQGDGGVNEARFRYPGPRPQTREMAILMLADGAEAAVRAAAPRSTEEVDAALERIFRQRITGGQLDDSDLSLRDLRRIRHAFTAVFASVFHPRVPYPEGARATEVRPEEDRGGP